jgi:hypothetical protein
MMIWMITVGSLIASKSLLSRIDERKQNNDGALASTGPIIRPTDPKSTT